MTRRRRCPLVVASAILGSSVTPGERTVIDVRLLFDCCGDRASCICALSCFFHEIAQRGAGKRHQSVGTQPKDQPHQYREPRQTCFGPKKSNQAAVKVTECNQIRDGGWICGWRQKCKPRHVEAQSACVELGIFLVQWRRAS